MIAVFVLSHCDLSWDGHDRAAYRRQAESCAYSEAGLAAMTFEDEEADGLIDHQTSDASSGRTGTVTARSSEAGADGGVLDSYRVEYGNGETEEFDPVRCISHSCFHCLSLPLACVSLPFARAYAAFGLCFAAFRSCFHCLWLVFRCLSLVLSFTELAGSVFAQVQLEAALTSDAAKQLVRQTDAYKNGAALLCRGPSFVGLRVRKYCGAKHSWATGTVAEHAAPSADSGDCEEQSAAEPQFEVDMWRVCYERDVIDPPIAAVDSSSRDADVPANEQLQCAVCLTLRRPVRKACPIVKCLEPGCAGDCRVAAPAAGATEWLDVQGLEVVLVEQKDRSRLRFTPAYAAAIGGAVEANDEPPTAPAAAVGGSGGGSGEGEMDVTS